MGQEELGVAGLGEDASSGQADRDHWEKTETESLAVCIQTDTSDVYHTPWGTAVHLARGTTLTAQSMRQRPLKPHPRREVGRAPFSTQHDCKCRMRVRGSEGKPPTTTPHTES